MDAKLLFPRKYFYGYHADHQTLVPSSKNLLDRGIDPKPMLIEFCEPMCVFWKEKLERCESKLEHIIKINPSKSCLYPMRDWITCVEACVQPKIFDNLEKGKKESH
jgi:ubiquinol-cytochrome c reductase subunit 6